MITFTIPVSYFGDVTQGDNFCQNIYWTPHSSNEQIVGACSEVWENNFNYKK